MAYFHGILFTDLSKPGYSEELLSFRCFFIFMQKTKLKTNGCQNFLISPVASLGFPRHESLNARFLKRPKPISFPLKGSKCSDPTVSLDKESQQ